MARIMWEKIKIIVARLLQCNIAIDEKKGAVYAIIVESLNTVVSYRLVCQILVEHENFK